MPISLSIDHPTPITIKAVFGSSYGTIGVQTVGANLEAPVAFGSIRAVGDYQIALDRSAAALLPRGGIVQGISAATGYGDFQELPVVEVFLGTTGSTVSEYWVRQGWAVPDETILARSMRHDQYVEALKVARLAKNGIWGERDLDSAAIGLSRELDQLTTPPPPHPEWATHMAITLVLVIAVMLGIRERYWRAVTRAQRAEDERLARVKGISIPKRRFRALRTVGGAWLGIAPGMFRPVPPLATPATSLVPLGAPPAAPPSTTPSDRT